MSIEDRIIYVTLDTAIEPNVPLIRVGVSDTLYSDGAGNIFSKENWPKGAMGAESVKDRSCYDKDGKWYVLLVPADSDSQFYQSNKKIIEMSKKELLEFVESKEKVGVEEIK